MPEDTEFERVVADLTAPLRDAVVGRYLGEEKARIGYPLDAILAAFATQHVVGMVAAFHHLAGVSDVPAPELDELRRSADEVFVWAPLVTSMLFHALKSMGKLDPRALEEVRRGLEAASDRIALLGHAEGRDVLLHPGPRVLPRLLARISSAYVAGVELARGPSCDAGACGEEGRRVRDALASIPARQRGLLEARYARGASIEQLAAEEASSGPAIVLRIGAALKRLEVGRGRRATRA